MRFLILLVLFFVVRNGAAQQIGNLMLTRCTLKKQDTITGDICGKMVNAQRLIVSAKTKVQLSCHYRNPAANLYDTVKITVAVSYAADPDSTLLKAFLDEIKSYAEEREAWGKKYNAGNDFTHLPYFKSFYISENDTVPFAWTGAENEGNCRLYYFRKAVYKIEMLECSGLGCLSNFAGQNMYFTAGDKKVIFEKYIKDIDQVKKLLAKMK